ncbi:MAG TPA: glycosyltransferase family 39 protein, partial [Thermoanaerobaculia bacterium]|nr:glycosyltransferase family 39 protein [Thermoanaerobaculia bacterium]
MGGLLLLLLPGIADWYRTARRRPREVKRESRRFFAAVALLFVFAFGVRAWGGVDRFPPWVDSDESATGLAGRALLAEGVGGAFGFWEMGAPGMTLVVSRAAAWPFGEGLRALRLGSALLGSLTVVLLFDFSRRLIGTEAGFLAALLLAVNHTFVHYSRVGHSYVETPFFASLVLALLLRSLTGGSFLALTGAGVALGIGAATYVPAQILPPLVAVTLAGWAIIGRWPSKGLVVVLAAVGGIAALTCAPMFATVLRMPLEIAYQRIPAISLLRSDGFQVLRSAYGTGSVGEAVGRHLLATVSIFNSGVDHFKGYGADRALADPVTAALIPAAFALFLSRLSSPAGWVSTVFSGAYLTGGVLLCSGLPTYHRILVVLLFSSLGVAWMVTGLARLVAPRRWPSRSFAAAAALVVFGASAWLNLHYYSRELWRTRLVDARFELTNVICRYAATHTVIDGTVVDGHEYVSASQYQSFQCPEAKRVRVEKSSDLWRFSELTDADRVVVILPSVVEAVGRSDPPGYRLVRRSVNTSIQLPAELPLSILEYERIPEVPASSGAADRSEGVPPVRTVRAGAAPPRPTPGSTSRSRWSGEAPSTG